MEAIGQDTFIFQTVDQDIESVVRKEKNSLLFGASFCDGKHLKRLLIVIIQVAGVLEHIADTDQNLVVMGELR